MLPPRPHRPAAATVRSGASAVASDAPPGPTPGCRRAGSGGAAPRPGCRPRREAPRAGSGVAGRAAGGGGGAGGGAGAGRGAPSPGLRARGLGAERQSPPCSWSEPAAPSPPAAARSRPQPPAARAMPNFAGTWKMRSSENFDELLKALGKPPRSVRACEGERPRGAPDPRGWAPGPARAAGSPRGEGEGEGSVPGPPRGSSGEGSPGAARPADERWRLGAFPDGSASSRAGAAQGGGSSPESGTGQGLYTGRLEFTVLLGKSRLPHPTPHPEPQRLISEIRARVGRGVGPS